VGGRCGGGSGGGGGETCARHDAQYPHSVNTLNAVCAEKNQIAGGGAQSFIFSA
jgi:hypothetical protein